MDTPDYPTIYAELAVKLGELENEQAELEGKLGDISAQIDSLRHTLNHLAPLAGYTADPFSEDVSSLGITDATEAVLSATNKMSAAEVRAKMQEQGFDFSKYSAPDATVRTILSRLVDGDKATVEKDGWKTFYKRKAAPQGPEISEGDIPF
jgi:hypothetical protein